ncbi:glycoside hydrolase family 15 protein [Desarmillaria tabescens]|uniref:Glycoside hydrolase family 15 protein n=1 Tax=Armillaria tabescens TaxID=1929756 RepID=A0AA39KFD7_ARMTA|nr:glycoside hydrolase family 15 protein [Desarmillaria tabescens]KAK0460162.1 glycoside hydrolase family 15 protein [Desarmillaria tabescens]
MNICQPKTDRDYIPISDHGLIGNLHTAALVSIDGSVESYCVPNFDSPSVFARILDQDKGGHFSITPKVPFTTKQNYLPSSNVLQTKFMNEQGVVSVTGLAIVSNIYSSLTCFPDFLPRQKTSEGFPATATQPLLHWLIRRVEYEERSLELWNDDPSSSVPQMKATFVSKDCALDLRYVVDSTMDNVACPSVELCFLDLSAKGHKGLGVHADLSLEEGQCVWFILRIPPVLTSTRNEGLGTNFLPTTAAGDPPLTKELMHGLLLTTIKYWVDWIRHSSYSGSWKEAVHRSALALKLLIFEPTGAVVASPTFSLPEYIGGTRNWDYRASWIRDSSFTLYALIRLGFTHEANAYMEFIFERLRHKNDDGSLQIMYTIHGGKDLEEIELNHLDGHKGSKPVRIGNGAADHLQLDIYGELMDCIYLGQKFGRPLGYDDWVLVRELVDYVVANLKNPDLSIWFAPSLNVHSSNIPRSFREVRNKKRHFTYSKMMLWVAIDRGLRLADKRSLPCPQRYKWLEARDFLYEEIMQKAWNPEKQHFGQSYEETHVLDSALLIMPLVFFMQGSDPRFVSTLKQILKTRERGGLTSNNLIFRYDVHKSDDGVGGEEGTFCLCTLWGVEALTRAGQYDRTMLPKAVTMFEDFLQYLNHVGLCTEEVSEAGEGLGNAVQGFT